MCHGRRTSVISEGPALLIHLEAVSLHFIDTRHVGSLLGRAQPDVLIPEIWTCHDVHLLLPSCGSTFVTTVTIPQRQAKNRMNTPAAFALRQLPRKKRARPQGGGDLTREKGNYIYGQRRLLNHRIAAKCGRNVEELRKCAGTQLLLRVIERTSSGAQLRTKGFPRGQLIAKDSPRSDSTIGEILITDHPDDLPQRDWFGTMDFFRNQEIRRWANRHDLSRTCAPKSGGWRWRAIFCRSRSGTAIRFRQQEAPAPVDKHLLFCYPGAIKSKFLSAHVDFVQEFTIIFQSADRCLPCMARS